MTSQQILEKAIQKAIDGGWGAEFTGNNHWLRIIDESGDCKDMYHETTWGSYSIIFNHDFAKALWGEGETYIVMTYSPQPLDGNRTGLMTWEHHLQQMVIADDPIKYLGDHL